MINYIPTQTIPPEQAGKLAVYIAAKVLCFTLDGQLPASQLQTGLDHGLAAVGLKPIPPHQIMPIWKLAAHIIQDPKACPFLLKH
jgi:hypothetical protein